jgi:hypothetical protein
MKTFHLTPAGQFVLYTYHAIRQNGACVARRVCSEPFPVFYLATTVRQKLGD